MSPENKPEADPAQDLTDIPDQPAPRAESPRNFEETDSPAVENTSGAASWALLDLLILALMTALTAYGMAKDKDDADTRWRPVVSAGLATLGALIFVLTNDPSGTMVMARPSTVLFLVLFAAQILTGTNLTDKLKEKQRDI